MPKSKITGDTACPGCRAKGGDSSGNHLILFDNGKNYCKRCGQGYDLEKGLEEDDEPETNRSTKRLTRSRYEPPELTVEQVKEFPYKALDIRGIKREVVEMYKVKCEVHETTGEVKRVYWPILTPGKIALAGFKTKDYSKSGKKRFHVQPIGANLPAHPHFFGAHMCKGDKRRLIITEGQEDAMAAFSMLCKYNDSSPKYKGIKPHVVSLMNGSDSIMGAIKHNYEFLKEYKQVYLCFDNDEAGDTATMQAVKALGYNNIKIIKLNSDYNDPNEALKDGNRGFKSFISSYFDAKEFTPSWVVSGKDINLNWLMKPSQPGLMIPFQGIMNKLHGHRPAEFTLVAALPGCGKSTFLRQWKYFLNTIHGRKCGCIFLEEGARKTAVASVALHFKIHLRKLMENPLILKKKKWKKCRDEVLCNEEYVNHFGSLSTDELMDKLDYLHYVKGCTDIFLDHISLVISGQRETISGSERKDIDILCTELASWVTKTECNVTAVVHVNRGAGKNKEADAPLTLQDLRGSGGLEQLAFNVIGLCRDTMAAAGGNQNIVSAWLLKNREWGDTGFCGTLIYDPQKNWLEDYQIAPKVD